jgi:hypothetical protein
MPRERCLEGIVIELLVGVLLLGFAGGYGAREIVSRRRRARVSVFSQLVLRSQRRQFSQQKQIDELKRLANIAAAESRR